MARFYFTYGTEGQPFYQYDPAKYAERVWERMKWDGEVADPDE